MEDIYDYLSGEEVMGDAFARAVSRQAVAQIALTVGCQHAYPSVLDSLADLVKDFIMQVGKAAQEKCEAEGRTALSVLDLKAALEHGQVFGKEPMQRLDVDFRHLQLFAFKESADSTEIGTPESLNWHQPFHTRIPPFPVRKRPRLPPSGWLPGQRAAHVSLEPGTAVSVDGSAAAARRPGYVPAFLPPFPPEHTYKRTARGAVSKTKDAAEIQKRRVETKQLVQRALRRMGGAFDDSAGEAFIAVAHRNALPASFCYTCGEKAPPFLTFGSGCMCLYRWGGLKKAQGEQRG